MASARDPRNHNFAHLAQQHSAHHFNTPPPYHLPSPPLSPPPQSTTQQITDLDRVGTYSKLTYHYLPVQAISYYLEDQGWELRRIQKNRCMWRKTKTEFEFEIPFDPLMKIQFLNKLKFIEKKREEELLFDLFVAWFRHNITDAFMALTFQEPKIRKAAKHAIKENS